MHPDLAPDCDACAALCCIALAFDAGDAFAIDKPAGLPCPHLERHACTIHDRLEPEGFAGCHRYDCAGAGQRTLKLHGGVSWRDHPAILPAMLETFRHLRWIHAQIALLTTAADLPLDAADEARRRALLARLTPADLDAASAETLATGPLRAEIAQFLRGLALHCTRRPPLRRSGFGPTSSPR